MKTTSIQANEYIKPIKPTHKRIIIETMQKYGKPMTFQMIAVKCMLTESQVWKRLSELEKDNLIEYTDLKGTTSSGCKAGYWKIKTKQLEIF